MAAGMCSRVWLDCFLRPTVHRAVQKPACQGGSHTLIYCPASAQHVLREAHCVAFTSEGLLSIHQGWQSLPMNKTALTCR